MKRTLAVVLALLLALSLVSVFANAEDTTVAAVTTEETPAIPEPKVTYAIYGTPTIDGEKDQLWEVAQINKVEKVFADNGLTEPCAAQFRVAYDEKYVYFYVEVLDNTMPTALEGKTLMESIFEWEDQNESWYNKDGVAFCFAPNGSKAPTVSQVAPTFWYILQVGGHAANYNQVDQNIFVTEDEGAVIADQNDFEKHPWESRMYATKVLTDSANTPYGYIIECKVNLKARYADFKAEAGTEIGFEMNINNNNYLLMSASRDYGLIWNDEGCMSYKDDSLKGTIILADQSKKFANTAEDEKLVIPTADTTPEEETTADPNVTTSAPVATSEPEVTTKGGPVSYTTPAEAEDTNAPETEAPESSGCGSVAAIGVAMIVTVLGAAYVSKKH